MQAKADGLVAGVVADRRLDRIEVAAAWAVGGRVGPAHLTFEPSAHDAADPQDAASSCVRVAVSAASVIHAAA